MSSLVTPHATTSVCNTYHCVMIFYEISLADIGQDLISDLMRKIKLGVVCYLDSERKSKTCSDVTLKEFTTKQSY